MIVTGLMHVCQGTCSITVRQHACFMMVAVAFIFFFSPIFISCIPKDLNSLIFTKLDSSTDKGEHSFGGKCMQK